MFELERSGISESDRRFPAIKPALVALRINAAMGHGRLPATSASIVKHYPVFRTRG
jgi:hypothetical protein